MLNYLHYNRNTESIIEPIRYIDVEGQTLDLKGINPVSNVIPINITTIDNSSNTVYTIYSASTPYQGIIISAKCGVYNSTDNAVSFVKCKEVFACSVPGGNTPDVHRIDDIRVCLDTNSSKHIGINAGTPGQLKVQVIGDTGKTLLWSGCIKITTFVHT